MKKITRATLNKAKKLYPVGTMILSLYGNVDIVTQHYDELVKTEKKETYWIDDNDGNIYVSGTGFSDRKIYDGENWAKIIENGKYKIIK